MTDGRGELTPDHRDRFRAMRVGIAPPADLWDRIARQTVRRRTPVLAWVAILVLALVGGGTGVTFLVMDRGGPSVRTAAVVLKDPLTADPFYAEREQRFRAGLTTAQQRALDASSELQALTTRLDSARAAFRAAPGLPGRDLIVRLAEERYFRMTRIVGASP